MEDLHTQGCKYFPDGSKTRVKLHDFSVYPTLFLIWALEAEGYTLASVIMRLFVHRNVGGKNGFAIARLGCLPF
jgi:hypothetical protein